MQRVRDPVFDRVLCRGQRLAKDLSAEYLGAANVAAVAAKDILLNSLQLEKCDQVVENRMHDRLRAGAPAVDQHARAADKCGIVARQE